MKRPSPLHRQTSAAAPRGGWRWAALGALLGLAITLTCFAPARWLAWGLAQASQGQVQLPDARGTVWNGSARLVLSGGTGSRDAQALPGRLHWRIAPGVGTHNIHLRADCCMSQEATVQLQAGWSTQQLRISDHTAQWPASLLTGLGAPWNTLQADGTLQWRTSALQLNWAQGRLQMQGEAQLEAQALSSRLSTLRPMGSYRIRLIGTPGGEQGGTPTPELQLSTLQGPLLLSGQGQWVGQRLRFTGEAQAEAGSEAALTNLLNIIGRRQGTRSLLSLG